MFLTPASGHGLCDGAFGSGDNCENVGDDANTHSSCQAVRIRMTVQSSCRFYIILTLHSQYILLFKYIITQEVLFLSPLFGMKPKEAARNITRVAF